MFAGSRLHLAVLAFAATGFAADTAFARCTRLAFSVNDYGKEGPIKDAKALLDTYIAKWTAERGIKSYTVGKKDVTCELFLDFGVFDEHTCKAAATVCWPGNDLPKATQAAAPADGEAPKKSKGAPPVAKATAKAADPVTATTAPSTTGSIAPPAATVAAPVAASPVAPAPVAPAPQDATPPAAPVAKTQ